MAEGVSKCHVGGVEQASGPNRVGRPPVMCQRVLAGVSGCRVLGAEQASGPDRVRPPPVVCQRVSCFRS